MVYIAHPTSGLLACGGLVDVGGCEDNKWIAPVKDPSRVLLRMGTREWWKVLLRQDNVTADKPDDNRQTPLHWATRNGHQGVVALLYSILHNLSPLALHKGRDLSPPLHFPLSNIYNICTIHTGPQRLHKHAHQRLSLAPRKLPMLFQSPPSPDTRPPPPEYVYNNLVA